MTLTQKARKVKKADIPKSIKARRRTNISDDEVGAIGTLLEKGATWGFIADFITENGPVARTKNCLAVGYSRDKFQGRLEA
tara:strand:+ start:99 stop:341 length:243 start_codon:yes stop_codon:yes gene_type:complete